MVERWKSVGWARGRNWSQETAEASATTIAQYFYRSVDLFPPPARGRKVAEQQWQLTATERRCGVTPQAHLYLLVTDQGFLSEQKVVWESLHNVEGDSNFCDSEFCLSHPSNRPLVYTAAQPPRQQIDQDYMVALCLQQQQQGPRDISDLELAKQLQEEEDCRALQYLQQQDHEAQPQAQAAGRQATGAGRQVAGERRTPREERSGKDCAIL
uniref:ubiquitin carboxyl-terminal hydrolase MINDY-1-like n=1 Tax=Pristiophorus japonicus TaxID=55135 RepID=UPI00398EC153